MENHQDLQILRKNVGDLTLTSINRKYLIENIDFWKQYFGICIPTVVKIPKSGMPNDCEALIDVKNDYICMKFNKKINFFTDESEFYNYSVIIVHELLHYVLQNVENFIDIYKSSKTNTKEVKVITRVFEGSLDILANRIVKSEENWRTLYATTKKNNKTI